MKRAHLLIIAASFVGCAGTSVAVVNSTGAPVAGAEVFLNGLSQGSTDPAGRFTFSNQLPNGAHLFARHQEYEHPSYRGNHGPGAGWVVHVYQTSLVVNNDGSVTDLTVTNPIGTQTLTVNPDNAILGWHLVASLNWDASDDELNQLVTRFTDASQYLYDLTDGQFVIEQVEIADDSQLWTSAEIGFQVDKWVWPHTTYAGGFLGPVGGGAPQIYLPPFSANGGADPRTIVHELGHLAMGLADEYMGVNAFGQNYCTEAMHSGTVAAFAVNGSRAACAMFNQFGSHKLCSGHPDSAHRAGNWQPGPCWDTIAAGYSEAGLLGGFGTGVIIQNRWHVRTPDMRGAVVGTLPAIPVGLQPKITVTNRKYHDLCTPFTFSDPAGAAAAGGTVWIRPSFWGGSDFTVGRLDANGSLVVSGVHLGDMIWSPVSIVPVSSTMCVVTQ